MAAIATLTVDLPQDDDLKTTLEAGLQALKNLAQESLCYLNGTRSCFACLGYDVRL